MNKFDVNALSLNELSVNEMGEINGGWLDKVVEALGDIAEATAKLLYKAADKLEEWGL